MSTAAPGPVEARILADLAPTFRVRHADARGGTLRILEGGDGPPIVLLHGRGNAATSWYPLLPALATMGRVLAVDLPGFGASHGHHFDGGGVEAAIDFFAGPIESWLLAEGVTAPAIVGHSLGGLVTLELALRRRVAPRAIVPIAPMGTGPEISLAARLFFRAGPERLARALGSTLFARLTGSTDPRAAALSFELLTVPGGRRDAVAAFDTLVPLAGPAPHRRDRLGSIDIPALILAGDHDEVFPAPLFIAAAATLPRGELRLLPLGHSPHTEAPDRVLPVLRAFLTAQIK
ncbi:MAG: alpha/beta fold hydrolase [Minicystis sp.]